jgi:hypothetical protein
VDDENVASAPQPETSPSEGTTPAESDGAPALQVAEAPTEQEPVLSFTVQFEEKAAHLPKGQRTTIDPIDET